MDIDNQYFVERDWGTWTLIDKGDGFKIKRLTILPNKSISMQYHKHRHETWCVLAGFGKAYVGERVFDISKHSSFYIPMGVTHKVWNNHNTLNLVIIEVQQGEIVREDDIVRLGEHPSS
jgi:mannose-1-phosphate guanylyltransferase / mannose-6-phosphate isomerase